MKRLVMVAGPAGVGKTTACRALFSMMDGCAWLDADWCWMVHPWHGKSEEQKRSVERVFGRILDAYLSDGATHTVLFSWLMSAQFMFDLVTSQIACRDYSVHRFALVCEREEYLRRLRADGRSEGKITNPADMAPFAALDARVLDVTRLTPQQTARAIWDAIGPLESE